MKIDASRRTILKLIIVTLPFGWIHVSPLPYTSLTFVLIYWYFASVVVHFPRSLSITAAQKYGIPLLAMWLLMLIRTHFDGGFEVLGSWSQLRQIVFFSVFFVFAVPDVKNMAHRGDHLERYYLMAMFGMIVAYFAGFANVMETTGRTTLEGLNPNVVGLYMAAALIIFLDILVRGHASGFGVNWRYVAVPIMLLMLIILYRTGSRGGILILAASALVYLFSWKRLTKNQLLLLYIFSPAALALLWLMMTTGLVADRMAIVGSDIRIETLWPAALDVVKNYPMLGAGFDRTALVMYERVGFEVAPHNELLKIATASGLIGLSLFALFLYNLLRQSIMYRKETGSSLRLALLLLVLLQLFKGGGALQLPFVWLMFLLISAPFGRSRPIMHKKGEMRPLEQGIRSIRSAR